jgi:hypothetical protein
MTLGIATGATASYLAARLIRIRDIEPAQQHTWRDAPVRAADFRDPGTPVSVVGAHGGAGTSTVARLLGANDVGRRWPDGVGELPPRVLLVARTHAAGLMAVSQALAGYCASVDHRYGPFLAGVVLVPDAPGRLPKPLRRRIKVLESATVVHRLPWVAEWRLSATASDREVAGRLRAFAEQAALALTPALLEGESCN